MCAINKNQQPNQLTMRTSLFYFSNKTKSAFFIMALFFLSFFIHAQNDARGALMSMSEMTIKPGHTAQFEAGVKAWKKCYNENNGDGNWNVWRRINGAGTVYTVTGSMENWAEMDDSNDPTDGKCNTLAINLITPHIESQTRNFARSMPGVSKTMPEDTKVVEVWFVKVKNRGLHNEIVKEVSKAIKAKEGNARGAWYSTIGGDSSQPDYFVATHYNNFAAMDNDREGVWKIYEQSVGKKKADEMAEKMRNNMVSDWGYMYALNEDLSN